MCVLQVYVLCCVCLCVCVCFLLDDRECFCCFSLAGRSDWLALGKGDIMFSPKPTRIPHSPSTAATSVRVGVCVCVYSCVRESEGGLCVQAITHSALSAKVLLVSLAKADEV